MSSNRLEQLEHTIMELGTEMFRLKHRLLDLNSMQEKFLRTLNGLKSALDEKGILTSEDFDMATDLLRLIEKAEKRPSEAEWEVNRQLAKKDFH